MGKEHNKSDKDTAERAAKKEEGLTYHAYGLKYSVYGGYTVINSVVWKPSDNKNNKTWTEKTIFYVESIGAKNN